MYFACLFKICIIYNLQLQSKYKHITFKYYVFYTLVVVEFRYTGSTNKVLDLQPFQTSLYTVGNFVQKTDIYDPIHSFHAVSKHG